MILSVTRRIAVERTEQGVAELLVEGARLILERVEIRADTSARPRMCLRRLHERGALTGATMCLVDPQPGDVQPAPADVAQQPTNHVASVVAQEDLHRLFVRLADAGHVEG